MSVSCSVEVRFGFNVFSVPSSTKAGQDTTPFKNSYQHVHLYLQLKTEVMLNTSEWVYINILFGVSSANSQQSDLLSQDQYLTSSLVLDGLASPLTIFSMFICLMYSHSGKNLPCLTSGISSSSQSCNAPSHQKQNTLSS